MTKTFKHKLILACAALWLGLAGVAQAAGGGIAWDKFPTERLGDQAALQRGAKLFVNYCLNCHGAEFMRYNRLRDIGLSEEQIAENLLFAGEKVGDLMKVPMTAKQGKEWFGAQPPDLTVIARSRADASKGSGADYLYTYLRTFYRDDSKATGWNNLAFPSVAMPHVMWELQGDRRPVFETRTEHGQDVHAYTGKWEQVQPGSMSQAEFDEATADLVAFLQWMGEPVQSERVRIGVGVLLFLAVFTVIAWRLNAAYWKDVK